MVEVRRSRPDDEAALEALDRATWSTLATPTPPPEPGWRFFDAKTQPEDVLVAEVDGALAGYVRLARATPLAASDHVLRVNGIAVDPAFRRRGVGRAMIDAAVAEAAARGARRVTLRVLGHNEAARRLYESAGFVVEGRLRGEFFLDGVFVDDIPMAVELKGGAAGSQGPIEPVS